MQGMPMERVAPRGARGGESESSWVVASSYVGGGFLMAEPTVDFVIVSVDALRFTDSLTAFTGEGLLVSPFTVVGVDASDFDGDEEAVGTTGTGGTAFPLALIVPVPDVKGAAALLVVPFVGLSLGFGLAATFLLTPGLVAVDLIDAVVDLSDAAEGGLPTRLGVVLLVPVASVVDVDVDGFLAFAAVLRVDIAELADGLLCLAAIGLVEAVVLTLTEDTADETDARRVLACEPAAKSDFAVLYTVDPSVVVWFETDEAGRVDADVDVDADDLEGTRSEGDAAGVPFVLGVGVFRIVDA